ncbi:helix-turn-helix transcriptional regulator [Streptomyces sp. R33]|uniref:Helix-turn-helix transcriptional regulator n=1 Tax=Streptomyces sp. R33 TaxID=3238629 RepID=A0AB39XWG4_9ACTN
MRQDPFGELLAKLRRRAGRTQEQQVDAIHAVSGRNAMTRRELSRYENNETIPTTPTIRDMAAAYGMLAEDLLQEAQHARARRRRDRAALDERDDQNVKRRTLLEGAVVVAAGSAEPWTRLTHAISGAGGIDEQATRVLVDETRRLHTSEMQVEAAHLRYRVNTHLDAITSVLPRAGRQQQALTIAAGETAALAGWLAWDLGDHRTARSYYQVAAECSSAAGHPPLRALSLAYTSYGCVPNEAITLLREAEQCVRGPGHATAAAWIHARHAEEAARLGDELQALRALDRARIAYEYADHTAEEAWVQFMTPSRRDSLVLSVYGQLRHPELLDAANEATQRLGDDLSDAGVVVLGDLAVAHLQGGSREQGVHVVQEFATAAAARTTTMGRSRASAIASLLPTSERDLAEHLKELAA